VGALYKQQLCLLQTFRVKGIVQPKMKISYSPSSCFKPVWVSFFCWTQKKIFWRMSVIKQLMDH